MARRPIPIAPSLSRRPATRGARIQILVVCEGSTEEDYIDHLSSLVGSALIEVKAIPDVGVPETVVARAIAEKNAMAAAAKAKSSDSFDALYSVWAMFDKDDFDVDEPKRNAAQNGIKVAFSNPCFELWGLMHIEEVMAASSRHDIQRRLKAVMPPYDHSRNPYFNHDFLTSDARDTALDRASMLRRLRAQDSEENAEDDPYTSVDKLVLEILRKSGAMPLLSELTADIVKQIEKLEASEDRNEPAVRKEISRLHRLRKELRSQG